MAETKWTDEQLLAINTRDKTLLVSAAAGSGKTATLTERIIRSLLDENSPMNIDSLLVVTFTNAAASELRAKISRALTDAVEKNPENKHLKRQLYLLPSAKIRTIDSFCNEILRANCDRVGVPPSYRIADTAEIELLAISIIEGLIESVYNGESPSVASPAEFEELCDCLTDSKRTEELAEVFRYIHLKCDSAEEGIDLLLRLTEKYSCSDLPVEENEYGRFLMTRIAEMTTHYLSAYQKYMRIFSSSDGVEKKYVPKLLSDIELLSNISSAKSYEGVRNLLLNFSLERLPSVKSADKTPDIESFVILRKMMKEDFVKISELFVYTTEMWQVLFRSLYRLLSVLYRFEAEFDRVFSEEKRRLGALSYSDIERYTYKCLINDGELTDIAHNVASQFDAIYIDEYQDVNSLQNRIFEAISRPNNRFMVGDIKQSIYGFRSARPEIFADMKSSFPYITESEGDTASIFMSRNFRCDKSVVDFVNNIFDRAFCFVGKSIGYVDGDKLVYSKRQDFGEPEYRQPKVIMVDKHIDDEKPEPQLVAKKIEVLLENGKLNNGNPIHPSDIAIILRNAKGKDSLYAEALENIGIPACISGAKDFFLSPEVLLALCLLNSIDNPRRDIYLAGLICSPLFDFTADDLYMIRRCDGETLYESLVNYTECNPEFTKGTEFLKKLNYYRLISEGISVDQLVYKLYSETGLMALASKNGGKDNLVLLYDYARSYEAGSFKGLYNFISFINSIIDKKTTFDDTRAKTGVDAVKIITCHASKGLEYPVVFLVDADSAISNKDKRSRLAFAEDFGISFRLRTSSGLCLVENPVRDIINLYVDKKLYEEELRVLYVALTRARERLFVTAECPSEKREEYETKLSVIMDNLSEYSFRELDSYLEIISCCRGSLPDDEAVTLPKKEDNSSEESVDEINICTDMADSELAEELERRFSFEYTSPHMTTLPEKMSVSLMSPVVLDGSDAESAFLSTDEEEKKQILPAFVTGDGADESAKRGIATHLFMQFCDIHRLRDNGASSELKRLTDEGFISAKDAERVRLREIEMFRKSKLFSEMLSAKELHRELRFNVRLPATEFTKDEDKILAYADKTILVQGVIDCVVKRADGSIALYDYKTDRFTREELSDRSLAENRLREKHKMQLGIYSLAIEKIFGEPPVIEAVYSLPLGDTVSMK